MPGGIEPKRGQIEPNIGYLGKLRKPEFWNCITILSFPVFNSLWGEKNNFSLVYARWGLSHARRDVQVGSLLSTVAVYTITPRSDYLHDIWCLVELPMSFIDRLLPHRIGRGWRNQGIWAGNKVWHEQFCTCKFSVNDTEYIFGTCWWKIQFRMQKLHKRQC